MTTPQYAKNFPQITSLPINPATGQWTPEWYAFLLKLFQSTGGSLGTDPADIEYAAIQDSSARQRRVFAEDVVPPRPAKAALLSDDFLAARSLPIASSAEFMELSEQVAGIKRNHVPQLKLTKTTYPALTLIQLWAGSTGSIPSGFQLCDGSNSTPDLRNLFVIGAGSTYAVGDTGGSTTISANNLPEHTHNYDRATDNTTNLLYTVGAASLNVDTSLTQTPTASTVNTTTATAYLQPYYAAAYIINTVSYTVVTDVSIQG